MNKELFNEMLENLVDMVADSEESDVRMKAIMKVEKVSRLNTKLMRIEGKSNCLKDKYNSEFSVICNLANELIKVLSEIVEKENNN